MKENKTEEWISLLKALRVNISEVKEELHSCLARLHITEMALNDLIRRLEEDEGRD